MSYFVRPGSQVSNSPRNVQIRVQVWKEMERMVRDGTIYLSFTIIKFQNLFYDYLESDIDENICRKDKNKLYISRNKLAVIKI